MSFFPAVFIIDSNVSLVFRLDRDIYNEGIITYVCGESLQHVPLDVTILSLPASFCRGFWC